MTDTPTLIRATVLYVAFMALAILGVVFPGFGLIVAVFVLSLPIWLACYFVVSKHD